MCAKENILGSNERFIDTRECLSWVIGSVSMVQKSILWVPGSLFWVSKVFPGFQAVFSVMQGVLHGC